MRDRILQVAAQEVNERGIKFTMEAVAARLGISKKTLYQHFPSKDSLVIGLTDAALQDVTEQLAEICGNKNYDFVSCLTATLFVEPRIFGKMNPCVMEDLQRYYPDEWEKIKKFRHDKVGGTIALLDEGVKKGEVRPVNLKVAAQMLQAAWNELLEYDFFAEQNISFSEMKQTVADIFLHGILLERRDGGANPIDTAWKVNGK